MNDRFIFSLRNQFVETSQSEHTRARIVEVHADTLRSRTSKGLLILGPSGAGKTTLIADCINTMFKERDVPGQKLTALHVDMPNSPSKKSLASALLEKLNDPFAMARSHSAEAKFLRVVILLKNLGVEILIIDEAQHVIDSGRSSAYEAADWIKDLMNRLQITVLLIGLKRTEGLLRANEQLRRRFSASVVYDRYSIDSADRYSQFGALVHAIHGILPVATIEFGDDEVMLRLYHATYGLMDYVMKILDRAVWLVQSKGLEGIDLSVLASAFRDEVWSLVPDSRNPFMPEFNFDPLIGSGEPFENFDTSKS